MKENNYKSTKWNDENLLPTKRGSDIWCKYHLTKKINGQKLNEMSGVLGHLFAHRLIVMFGEPSKG